MKLNTKFSPSFIAWVFVTLSKTAQAFNGDATYYKAGLGHCGWKSQDTDNIVALSTQQYNNGAHCGQHIKVYYRGKSTDATVVDSCPGCSQYSIDLSPAAFKALAPLDAGRIQVRWNFG